MKKGTLLAQFVGLAIFILSLNSCGINSNLMYKAPTTYQYDSLVKGTAEQYKIAINDKLKINFFKSKGEAILDMQSGSQDNRSQMRTINEITYLVLQDGSVEFPLVGNVKIAGLTTVECRDTLVKLLSKDYVEPFVQVEVLNKRCFVFPGTGGDAQVVNLTNENTTLMEALALAGGIKDRGKAKSVRVMRKEGEEWKVFKIDLSKIEGLEDSDMIVQANDYIYVDPSSRIAREVLEEVAPIFSIISSAAVIITVVTNVVK